MVYDCSSDRSFVTFICPSCGETYNFRIGCHSRICPTCNRDKSLKLIKKYRSIDNYLVDAYFVTLTVVNVKSDKLKDSVSKMRNSIHKLCNRAPYRRWFSGGLYAIEFTYNVERDDFNLHAHMCIDSCIDLARCDFLGYASSDPSKVRAGLKQDWFEITGDSYIVDWQKTRHPKSAISYCLKYVTKTVNYGGYDKLVCEALYKTRMLSFFGVCYDVQGIARLPFTCLCGYSGGLEFYCVGCYSRGGYWYNGQYRINPLISIDDFG